MKKHKKPKLHYPTLQNSVPSSAVPHPIETAILSAGVGTSSNHMNQIYGGGGVSPLIPPNSSHHHHHHHHHHHPKSHGKSSNN